jgi:hypothetical protein
MKIYLDNCSLHRPLDDRTHPRINLEAEAILSILMLCEKEEITLVSSDILLFEVNRNPYAQSKAIVSEILAKAPLLVSLTDAIEQRAKELEGRGFKALDALHLACAEAEASEYFCSCDDRLLNRARVQTDFTLKVVSPLELAQEVLR